MRFPTGNAGFVVVIAAILGTVLIGYVLTVETSTETATEFEETADITGLFNTSAEPEYLEYEPPANWTGYRSGSNYWLSGIDYDVSERATPYIVPQQDRTATFSGVVTGNDNPYSTSYLFFRSWATGAQVVNPKLVSLASVVEGLALSDDITMLDIWTASGGPIVTGYSEYFPSVPVPTSQRYLATDPDTRHIVINLNDTNKRTALYNSDGQVTNALPLSSVGVFYGGDLDLTGDFTYQGTRDLPIIYMDPSGGVSVTDPNVSWSNGYENSELTVIIERPGTLHFEVDLTNGEGLDVTVSAQSVDVSNYGGSPIHFSVADAWEHFALRFDFLAGSVEFLPIVSWVDFASYTTAPGTTYYQAVRGVTDSITFHSTAAGARFGIADTIVYLDTSKVVMQNPHIDITDYWPDPNGRVQFNGYAMYGQSVTVNGQTFAVDDGKITVDGTQYELSNLRVEYLDGKTTMTIGARSFDLGATASHLISYAGTWYFTASYWEAVEVDKTVYDWQAGTFGLGSTACIAAYLGLLVLGTAILHRTQTLAGGDLMIIACAGVVGYVLMDVVL